MTGALPGGGAPVATSVSRGDLTAPARWQGQRGMITKARSLPCWFLPLAARSYRDCAAYAAEPFWHHRAKAAPQPAAPRAPVPLEALLPLRVRLPYGSKLEPTPCIVGDRIELRRALSHPALPRPVAFLGDSELAPLLDQLGADRRLRDVVEDWARSVTPATAYSIAGWLANRGLLDPI